MMSLHFIIKLTHLEDGFVSRHTDNRLVCCELETPDQKLLFLNTSRVQNHIDILQKNYEKVKVVDIL